MWLIHSTLCQIDVNLFVKLFLYPTIRGDVKSLINKILTFLPLSLTTPLWFHLIPSHDTQLSQVVPSYFKIHLFLVKLEFGQTYT